MPESEKCAALQPNIMAQRRPMPPGATVNERGAAAMKHTDRHARTRSYPVMRPHGRMDFIPAAR